MLIKKIKFQSIFKIPSNFLKSKTVELSESAVDEPILVLMGHTGPKISWYY